MANPKTIKITTPNGVTHTVKEGSKAEQKYRDQIKAAKKSTPTPRTVSVSSPSTSGKKVIGQYNKQDVYAGTEAEIQAQMRAIDAGGRSSSSSSSSSTRTSDKPKPDTTSIYDTVIKANPVLADMLKDPDTKARYDSLSPDLQGIFLQTAQSLGKAIEDGKVVNPNIELTPKENAKLLKQAETELDPYYREQLGFLKDEFDTSIGRLMEDWNTSTSREGEKFKRTLDENANAEAESGTAFSSGRIDRENQAVTGEQQALDDAALEVTRKATDTAKEFEKKAGSSTLRSLNIPQLTTFTASNTGLGTGGSRTLYTGLGNIDMGTQEKERLTAVKTRQSELEQAFRANRLLDLSKLR